MALPSSSTPTSTDDTTLTPVQQSNLSAALPGGGNALYAAGGGSAAAPTMSLSAMMGGGSSVAPARPAPVQVASIAPAVEATPPAPVQSAPAAAATVPTAPEKPTWQQFLNQRSISYGWSSPVSRGVGGAEEMNPLFGTRLAQAVADGEAATGQRAVFNDMERSGATQAQYYADYRGRPVTWNGQTFQPDPSRLGRIAARPPQGETKGSRHQIRDDNAEMGTGYEAVDFSRLSPQVRDYVRSNHQKYGLQLVNGDLPHVQLDRSNPMSQVEAEGLISKMGFASIEDYQRARNAAVDGIVGPETRSKLIADLTKDVPSTAMAFADEPSRDTLTAADMNATDFDGFNMGMLGVQPIIRGNEVTPAKGEPVPSNFTPGEWGTFQRNLQAGNVPWDDLPEAWRTELTTKLGPTARAQYDAKRDAYVAETRGGTVVGETRKNPETWGNVGTPNGRTVMDYYVNTLGMPPHEAAAFVGGFAQESYPDIQPTAYNEGEDAYGIAQWRGDRLTALKAFPAKVAADPELKAMYDLPEGADFNDLRVQAAFAHYERSQDPKLMKALEEADTAEEAAAVVAKQYERTADKPGDEGYQNRVKWARAYAGEAGDVAAQGTPAPTGEREASMMLQKGSRGSEVAAYQMMLAGMGFYRAGVDQDFGRRTDSAVRAFQAANGLKVDGVIGPVTSAAIESQWAGKVQNPRPREAVAPYTPPAPFEERLAQSRIRGGPVRLSDAEYPAWQAMRAANATDQAVRMHGGLGTPETAMSLQDYFEGNAAVPSIDAAIAARGGNHVNVAGKGDRMPTLMERQMDTARANIQRQVATEEARRAWLAEQGTVPAGDRPAVADVPAPRLRPGSAPSMTVKDLNEAYPVQQIKGGEGSDDIRGDSGVDWLDAKLKRGREMTKGEESSGGSTLAPPDGETRPDGASQPPQTAFGRSVKVTETARTDFDRLTEEFGAGALRGGEDTIASVADAMGWTVGKAADALAAGGVISPEAATAIHDSEQRRDDYVRQRREEWEQEYGQAPAAIAGRIFGQIAATGGPIAGSLQAVKWAARGAPAIAEFISGGGGALSKMTAGAIAGAEASALTSASSDEPLGPRMMRDAVIGAAGGLAFEAGGKAVNLAVNQLKKIAGTGPRVNTGTIAALSEHLDEIGMSPDDAIAKLRGAKDSRIYDLDPSLAAEAGALANSGNNKATSILKNAAKGTQVGQDAALLNDMDRILGPARNGNQVKALIAEDAQNRAGPLYDQAKSRGIALDAKPALAHLDQALSTTKNAAARNALNQARKELHTVQGDDLEIDVDALHRAREALDDQIYNAPRALDNNMGRAALRAIKDARSELDKALKSVPEMAQADKIWSGNAKLGEAYDMGASIWKMKLDDFSDAYKNATAAERVAIAAGARNAMAEAAAVGSGPLNGLTGKVLRNPDNQAKFRMAFGQGKGDEALDAIANRLDQRASARVVAQNSETASRQARQAKREEKSGLAKAVSSTTKGAAMGGLAVGALTRDAALMPHGAIAGAAIANVGDRLASKIHTVAVARREAAMAAALTMKGREAIDLLEAVKSYRNSLASVASPSNKLLNLGGRALPLANEENRRRLIQGRTIEGYRDSLVPTGN